MISLNRIIAFHLQSGYTNYLYTRLKLNFSCCLLYHIGANALEREPVNFIKIMEWVFFNTFTIVSFLDIGDKDRFAI